MSVTAENPNEVAKFKHLLSLAGSIAANFNGYPGLD